MQQDDTRPGREVTPVPSPVLEPGIQVDRYAILHLLGEGGEARVYLASDSRLGIQVALKVFRLGTHNAGESPQDLVKRLAALDHPGIVRVIDAKLNETPPWMAMQLIQGGTVAELMGRGPLPWRRAVRLAIQAAGALVYLHDQGQLHLDIKPSNLFVGAGDHLWLGDLGISIVMGDQSVAASPRWCAPERFEGKAPTPASDLYSLGLSLYAMLSGSPPFDGSFSELAQQHLNSPLPVLETKAPDIPTEVAELVRWMCARNPVDRPRDARAVIHRLERCLRAEAHSASKGWYVAAAAASLLGAVGLWSQQSSGFTKSEGPLRVIALRVDEAGEPEVWRNWDPSELLQEGDCLVIQVTLAEPAYVWIRLLESGGGVENIFPAAEVYARLTPAAILPAGRHELPSHLHACVRLDGHTGVERIQVVVTNSHLPPWPDEYDGLVIKGADIVERTSEPIPPCDLASGRRLAGEDRWDEIRTQWCCIAIEHGH